jgi:hypothetical protein
MSIRQRRVPRRVAGALLCAVVVLAGSPAAPAEPVAPVATSAQVAWIRQFGSPAADGATGVFIGPANVAAAYVVGVTDGSLPGQVSQGARDGFLRKYRLDGSVEWTRQFGTAAWDEALGVKADSWGVSVVGSTSGTFPGETNSGGADAFIRRYDADGNVEWTRQFGTEEDDEAVSVSGDGSIAYVAGYTDGLFPGASPGGGRDGFVSKYGSGGEIWTTQFGTSESEDVGGVTATASRVHVVGSTSGVFPGQASEGLIDGFLVTLDWVDGAIVRTRQFGTSADDRALAVAASSGWRKPEILVGGQTLGTFSGESSSGGPDAFLRTYDVFGSHVWTSQFGTSGSDEVRAVAAPRWGFYAAGLTSGSLPGQSSAGAEDTFVRRFRPGGVVAWTRQLGTTGNDRLDGMTVARTGVYVAGRTASEFADQTSVGLDDAFVARLVARRPDGRIRRKGKDPVAGDNIYNTTGVNQTKTVEAAPGESHTFLIRVQNDGDGDDRITVDGCGTARGFRVRYLEGPAGVLGSKNVTSTVVAGTFTLPATFPSEIAALRLRMTVTYASTPGATRSCKVLLSSAQRPAAADAVRVRMTALG